jgi:hypothetical protein
MPHEVFLNVEGTLERGVHKERKPQWLCFSSLHALCAVQSIISQHTDSTLALVEALPGRAQHWAHDQTGEARATELMTLLRWSTDLEQEESHT